MELKRNQSQTKGAYFQSHKQNLGLNFEDNFIIKQKKSREAKNTSKKWKTNSRI